VEGSYLKDSSKEEKCDKEKEEDQGVDNKGVPMMTSTFTSPQHPLDPLM